MKLTPTNSSSIGAAGYDPRKRILRVRFVGGGTYDYLGVPEAVFSAFRAATSKGRFVNWKIKPRFPFRPVA